MEKTMRTMVAVLVLLCGSSVFASDHYVRPHIRRDGSFVQGHFQTNPDETVNNNYGTEGNVNPYTGRSGHRPRKPAQVQGGYNTGNGFGDYPAAPDARTLPDVYGE